MKSFDEKNMIKKTLKSIITKDDSFWENEGEKMALDLFHATSARVPAYKDFLKQHKIKTKNITSYKDLRFIPSVNKDNYLRKYSLKDLSWDGTLKTPLVFTATTGSTGEPVYFSRNQTLDLQSSVIHELYFTNNGFDSQEPTLIVICFGMGVWIGGLITYQAFQYMQKSGYPLSIITPGINKTEIFKTIKKLGPNFKQMIIVGYPPFLKDIIDGATKQGIDLHRYNIKLLFAAEVFTEKFREYLAKKIGMKNTLLNTMNIYGSAEIGTMSFETPLSILIRKIAAKDPTLFSSIFSSITKTPTLTQYVPSFISWESSKGNLLLTGNNSMPLIRYSIGDHGGVLTFKEMQDKFLSNGIDLQKEIGKAGISEHIYQLPFVYVYERADFSTTLYGLQIYPETIKETLLKKPFDTLLTGKFTLITKFDIHQDQYLEINLETQKEASVSKGIEEKLIDDIIKNLRIKNSEFRELSDYLKDRVRPQLVFWPTEDPLYFKPGIKQEWVKKEKQ